MRTQLARGRPHFVVDAVHGAIVREQRRQDLLRARCRDHVHVELPTPARAGPPDYRTESFVAGSIRADFVRSLENTERCRLPGILLPPGTNYRWISDTATVIEIATATIWTWEHGRSGPSRRRCA